MVVERGAASRAGKKRAITPCMPPQVCPRQGSRSPMPRFCAAGAGGIATVETCVEDAAKLRTKTRTRRRYIAAKISFPLHIKPVILTLPSCTSAELFFFCCDSVAALPALANCNEHVTKTKIS